MMNKIINILFTIPLTWILVSCYNDKGNYDYTELDKVTIHLKDTVYATQFRTLELDADILFEGASESDYNFCWKIWPNDLFGTWEQKVIGTSRKLSYKVTEVTGVYTLVLTLTHKTTEVKSYKSILVSVQSNITEGVMVLHEKNGISDFDLIMSPYFSTRVQADEILHNVYETVNGERLIGRGVKINGYFCLGGNQEVVVLTDQGGARLSAITMQRNFDMSTLISNIDVWKPENYFYWHYSFSPGRNGYDAIISNGRFYEYSGRGIVGFTTYTEPILKDGLTSKASPYAPKWFDYYQGILYDELSGRFLGIENDSWILKELAKPTKIQPFDWNNMQATLRYMDTGYNNYEYGLFEDNNTHELSLCVFNFDVKPNIGVAKYSASKCKELVNAKYYAVGDLGPLFIYADEKNIYRFDYNGAGTEEYIYSLKKENQLITGIEILKPCIDRFIMDQPYNNRILLISTYDKHKKEGILYMYNINVTNGSIDITSEKMFDGFGEILDIGWNYAKIF